MGYPTVSAYTKAYVRARAEAHMDSKIKITRGVRPGYLNRTTGLVEAHDASTIYIGKARIWGGSDQSISVMESDLTTTVFNVSIPWTKDIRNDDIVTVTLCPGDPFMVGQTMRVTSSDSAQLSRATRRLSCIMLNENRSWDS